MPLDSILSDDAYNEQGPWLISKAQFSEFTQIIEDSWARLSKESSTPEKGLALRGGARELEITVVTKGAKHRFKTFKEIFSNPHAMKSSFISFEMNLEAARSYLHITLDRRKLRISSFGSHPEFDKLRSRLESWADEHRPPVWQRMARDLSHFHWVFALLLICLGVPFALMAAGSENREQARKLLQDGISNEEMQQAMALLIEHEYELYADYTIPGVGWLAIFGALWICIVISVMPPNILSFGGRGERRVKSWRLWMGIATASVPALLIAIAIELLF